MSDTTKKPMVTASATTANNEDPDVSIGTRQRSVEALKQLFCGGIAGSTAKTITAPFSRLTILFQVHSLVTTKENRPKFAMTFSGGMRKIVERGGVLSLWKGNGTSVLHRFPFSAINFYCYENTLDYLNKIKGTFEDEIEDSNPTKVARFTAGAVAGCTACICCYPLDLVRTRLTTELPGRENYKGIIDAITKIATTEGPVGFYSGIGPTLAVAVPNFAISYTVYGSLKEYVLDDELFYNLRKIDDVSGEKRLGLRATLLCGAASGFLSTLVTFPCDTTRRRMQIQNLHIPEGERQTGRQLFAQLAEREGIRGLYRGLTPELLKVAPMVGTMFFVYEQLKNHLNVGDNR